MVASITAINLATLNVFGADGLEKSKIRLGRPNDGGYVIVSDFGNYDLLIGAGICDDISFELGLIDFLRNQGLTSLPTYLFDGTIETCPDHSNYPNVHWVKKNIGPTENNKETNLGGLLDVYKNVFLKMDIEGAEYDWLMSLNDSSLKSIKQIVIEFHNNINGSFTKKEVDVFRKLSEHFYLVHVHGNNFSGLINIDGIVIPQVFECTYIRKRDAHAAYGENTFHLNNIPFPTILDQPNKPTRTDYKLNYAPFYYHPYISKLLSTIE